jgi:hypothetical protein
MINEGKASNQLRLIKKSYGEKFSHMCRDLFPSLIERGILYDILLDRFQIQRELYTDIVGEGKVSDFEDYIHSTVWVEGIVSERDTPAGTPFDLMLKAGYKLFECKTEEDVQEFKKYYREGESLCTFDSNRLKDCYVFFAVKVNVGDIRREDFNSPERQDAYGTSVISIQFTRGVTNHLSIKNRYNHTVSNSNATFSNNLDKIIDGLTDSFMLSYRFKFGVEYSEFELRGYVTYGIKMYKYNIEVDGVYYCVGNKVIEYDTVVEYGEDYILLDYYVLDLKAKKLGVCDSVRVEGYVDCFTDYFLDITKIEVRVDRVNDFRVIRIWDGGVARAEIKERRGRVVVLRLLNVVEIGQCFMLRNKYLEEFYCSSVGKIDDKFMVDNRGLRVFSCPNLTDVGYSDMSCNGLWEDDFGSYGEELEGLNCPKLKAIGDSFLENNNGLKELKMESLVSVGNHFMRYNKSITSFNCPNLVVVGNSFMLANENLGEINCERLVKVGIGFMCGNTGLTRANFPNLREVGEEFMLSNILLDEFTGPKLRKIGRNSLVYNSKLRDRINRRVHLMRFKFSRDKRYIRARG